MLKTTEIIILLTLFIYYLLATDILLYFITIYILVLIYNIYIIFKILRYNCNDSNYFLIKYFFISIFLYICSYFIIYNTNPISYLFTFFLPFDNYFKGIFILIFHTYYLNKFSFLKKGGYETLPNSPDVVIIRISKSHDNYNNRFEFFLSKLINSFKKNKKLFFLFISVIIIIKIILYFYRTKFWIYFNSKEDILPISTSKNTTFYITACVYQMEPIIVDFINEMKKVIKYLGESNIIVSIVENGDSKDNTRYYLEQFQKYLNEKQIRNKFILTKQIEDPRKGMTLKKDKDYARIKFLTDLRNLCFDYLYEIPNLNFETTKIINFNDIIFTYEDVIKLISTNNEDYDAVCGMDFYFNFYDTWVSVDLNGNTLQSTFPFFINKEAQELVINKKPIRVFSCWNGLIVFKASVFKNKKLKFRIEKRNNNTLYRFNRDKELINIGYESECTLFHVDLQSLGFNKRFINPDVRVAYNYIYYYLSKYLFPNTFEVLFYFINYIKSFIEKRNKLMSNLKEKTVMLSQRLYGLYLFHKTKKKAQ